jgi:hypothetical protein
VNSEVSKRIIFPDSIESDNDVTKLYIAAENAVEAIRDGAIGLDGLEAVREGMADFGAYGAQYMEIIDEAYATRSDWAQVGDEGDGYFKGFLERLSVNRGNHLDSLGPGRFEGKMQFLIDQVRDNPYLNDEDASLRSKLSSYGGVSHALMALETNYAGVVSGDLRDLCSVEIDAEKLPTKVNVALSEELDALQGYIEDYRAVASELKVPCEP